MLLGNFEEHMTKPRHSIDREGSKAHDRTEDTRETSERDINRGRVLHNDESSLEMRNNYPFGK